MTPFPLEAVTAAYVALDEPMGEELVRPYCPHDERVPLWAGLARRRVEVGAFCLACLRIIRYGGRIPYYRATLLARIRRAHAEADERARSGDARLS